MLFEWDQYPLMHSLIEGVVTFGFCTIEVAVLSIAFRELFNWNLLSDQETSHPEVVPE